MTRYVCLILVLVSFQSKADWYQGKAQVEIPLFGLEDAREVAIKHAVANASFEAGSYILAEQVSLGGLLSSSKATIQSSGRIRRVEVLDEHVSKDVLTVTVRADITPSFSCDNDTYKKKLMVAQIPIVDPSQANVGALFSINKQVEKRLLMQINARDKVLHGINIQKAIALDNQSLALSPKHAASFSRYFSRKFNSQFIVFPLIRDLSLFDQVTDELLIDSSKQMRNFTLELTLYDAIRGEPLFSRSYHSEAQWPFSLRQPVDLNSSTFWRSDYGKGVLNNLSQAIDDIEQALKCEKTLTHITSAQGNRVIIGLGESHKVKIGDDFSLVRVSQQFSMEHFPRPYLHADMQQRFKVISVNQMSATLVPKNNSLMQAQMFDLLTPLPQQ